MCGWWQGRRDRCLHLNLIPEASVKLAAGARPAGWNRRRTYPRNGTRGRAAGRARGTDLGCKDRSSCAGFLLEIVKPEDLAFRTHLTFPVNFSLC